MPGVQPLSDEPNGDDTTIQSQRKLQYKNWREAEQLFRKLDTDGDGYLDLDELCRGLRHFQLPTSHARLEELFRHIDTSGNGLIDVEEFTVFLQLRLEQLQQTYDWILQHQNDTANHNKHGGGGFTAQTLRTAAQKSGVPLSDDDVTKIMNRLDQNQNQHVSFDEFRQCLLLAPEVNPKRFLDSWYIDAYVDDAQSESTLPREIRLTNEEEETFTNKVIQKLVLGGVAGCLSRTLTAPMDRIRILMMTATTTTTTTTTSMMGIRGAIQQGTSGGFLQLWKGNGANCLKITPEMAIKLLAFDSLKNTMANDPQNVTFGERFVAGGLAGVASQVSIYPLEVVKTKLAVSVNHHHHHRHHNHLGIVDCVRQTVVRGGYRALYSGLGPSVFGIIPYAAIDLSVNSILKEVAADVLQHQKQDTSVPVLLGCGMVSSGTATLVTFPLNVIRTKAQATGESFGVVLAGIQRQGPKAFYRGLIPSLAKVLPATSISYAAYEYLAKVWDHQSAI